MSELDLLRIDIDKLFEQHTVSEILEIHKKIQVELDKKRQELRYMVGERYRDVITAADAIKSMQISAENLYSHIDQINNKCHILQSSINIEDEKPIVVDRLRNFYRSIAIQIKILISVPEYIWMCLDNGDLLKAVHLYLFAIHIHTGLELDTEHNIAETFTILSRLRLSINSFRNRILDGIKKKLQAVNLHSKEASNHLCAFMLLENKSQENVIEKFIELRQIALNDLLNADMSQHNVVRVQIINLMNCLICTIMLLRSCFIEHEDLSNGLVQLEIKKILSADAEGTVKLVDLESTPLLEYLPSLVKAFRPSCTEAQISLSNETIPKIVNLWLQSTTEIINKNLSKSLELITSMKTLQTIREEALKIESLDKWDKICTETFLPNNFTVWYYFFQPLVSKRAETLICQKYEIILAHLYDKISMVFNSTNTTDQEKDLRWYIWTEDSNDLSRDSNSHQGLRMKTKGYSTKIVSLCNELDGKYSELLQDVSIYLNGLQNEYSDSFRRNESGDQERTHLMSHLRKEANCSIEKIINRVELIINSESDSGTKVIKSVMAARLLHAMTQLCPNLVKSCSYIDYTQDWEQVHTLLTKRTLQFWTNWLNHARENIQKILTQFLKDIQFHTVLRIFPSWNTIEIEEQTDDKVFNSQIRIPSQPSVSLLSVLSDISIELNEILPHTLPKIIHTQFTEIIAELILNCYDDLTKNDSVNQNMALQFLVDVKYLTTICVNRNSKEFLKKSQQICDAFRSKIDPFDLDVFYPYLQTNIKRSVLQSQTFFGCFLPGPAQLASLGTLESKTIDNDPCIIAMSAPSSETWFPLLPVTAPVLKTMNIATLPAPNTIPITKKEIPTSKDDSEPSSGSTFVRSGAAALFGAMTNDWFS